MLVILLGVNTVFAIVGVLVAYRDYDAVLVVQATTAALLFGGVFFQKLRRISLAVMAIVGVAGAFVATYSDAWTSSAWNLYVCVRDGQSDCGPGILVIFVPGICGIAYVWITARLPRATLNRDSALAFAGAVAVLTFLVIRNSGMIQLDMRMILTQMGLGVISQAVPTVIQNLIWRLGINESKMALVFVVNPLLSAGLGLPFGQTLSVGAGVGLIVVMGVAYLSNKQGKDNELELARRKEAKRLPAENEQSPDARGTSGEGAPRRSRRDTEGRDLSEAARNPGQRTGRRRPEEGAPAIPVGRQGARGGLPHEPAATGSGRPTGSRSAGTGRSEGDRRARRSRGGGDRPSRQGTASGRPAEPGLGEDTLPGPVRPPDQGKRARSPEQGDDRRSRRGTAHESGRKAGPRSAGGSQGRPVRRPGGGDGIAGAEAKPSASAEVQASGTRPLPGQSGSSKPARGRRRRRRWFQPKQGTGRHRSRADA